jgi:FMN-dependent oxidoreductase (nitrilotriacetate monooxygenase family)
MSSKRGKMILGAYYNPTGHHVASWRHPRAQEDAHVNIEHYIEIAQTAERAKFDLMFLADSNVIRDAHIDALSRSTQFVAYFEPLTLLSALAMVTKHIGLIGTASTSWNQPYHIARKFASLDHISKGRAGWNAVTSVADKEAQNFGRDKAYPHADRYDRAHEVIEIVQGLWDSWDDDAFLRDKESGLFFDKNKLHELNHKSERYKVRGPLNVPRSPQGYPLVVQAGASPEGRELAAHYAEAIFSPHLNYESAKAYYDDTKGCMAHYNRNPDHLKILPGISIFVKPTEAEAREDYAYIQSLIHPIVGQEILTSMLGVDMSPYDYDGPFPDPLPATKGSQGHRGELETLARKNKLTVRQLAEHAAGARGKNVQVGTPQQIADYLEDWFERGACDGFTIMPPYIPGGLDDFCELVIPELQRRGLFRTEYEGTTLRENLGLPRPVNRHAAARRAAE